MPAYDLEAYVTVNDRIQEFWKSCLEKKVAGSITTELIHLDESEVKNRLAIVRAVVSINGSTIATGLAKEREGTRGANVTSFIENCETSAIGRALANYGIAVEKQRPSREEMQAVQDQHADVLAEIQVLVREINDEELKRDLRSNWPKITNDCHLALTTLDQLKEKVQLVEV